MSLQERHAASLGGFLAAVALLLSATRAGAFAFGLTDCDRLVSGSGVVVLAVPLTKTSDTGEGAAAEPRAQYPYIWVQTTFRVIGTLKGQMKHSTFVLHHLREPTLPPLDDGRVQVFDDGPPLVEFDPSQAWSQREFVLFLVREPGGRYAPYPDQATAGAQSVYPMYSPPTAREACEWNPFRHPGLRTLGPVVFDTPIQSKPK